MKKCFGTHPGPDPEAASRGPPTEMRSRSFSKINVDKSGSQAILDFKKSAVESQCILVTTVVIKAFSITRQSI
jgi:hypothetical protein